MAARAQDRAFHAPALAGGTALSQTLVAGSKRAVLIWLVPLTLLHGLLYLLLLPPWQHYDETAHFLYAAEIAAGEIASPGSASGSISREIADSMYRFGFYRPEVRPDLAGTAPPTVGISQRVHPPLYYTVVAIPLRALHGLSIELQLYAARAVSLIFYLLTIITVWRIAVALAPDEPVIQRLMPLLVLLVPAFADIMTAVNNDVLLNFSLTVALLGAVILVRDGLRPFGLALALLGLLVAFMTKRVALVACVPLAVALIWSLWQAPLRWWVTPLLLLGVSTALGMAVLQPTVVESASGPHTILAVRPWFTGIADSYLRVDVDAAVRSFTDAELIGDRYKGLIIIAFGGFYSHFGWGQVTLGAGWVWLLAGVVAVANLGLLVGGLRSGQVLTLWQQRCLWIFMLSVVVAWISMFARMHPLPPLDVPVYIPRGRYMFWAIVPNLWLLCLGLAWVTPERWRPYAPPALLALFICLDTYAWLWVIPHYYYR